MHPLVGQAHPSESWPWIVATWADSDHTHQLALTAGLVQRLPELNVGSQAYGSFQLMYMSHNDDNAANDGQLQMSNGGQREDKAILALTTSLSGWVLTQKCQSWQCDQNLHGPLLRAILLMTIKVSVWAMAANGEKSDRKSTKVSYSTNMIRLGQCTMVIMTL